MFLNLLFLIPLFIIGIICSYTDVKYGKIKNKWIAAGFIWTVFLYCSLVVYNYFYLHQTENINYLMNVVINGFLALLISYLFWNFNFLAAGDAKLFTLYAFLIPHEFYSNAYFPLFPSFVLLVNIFIPLILFLTFKTSLFSFDKGLKKIKEISFNKIFTKENFKKLPHQLMKFFQIYIILILMLIIIRLSLNKAVEFFGDSLRNFSFILLFFFLFFIYRFLFQFISKNKLIGFILTIIGIICVFYLSLTDQKDFLFNILRLSLIFMVLMGIFYRILNFYIEQKEIQKIKIKNLKEGMFPSFYEMSGDLQKRLGSIGKTGLTSEQLRIVQEFFKSGSEQEIRIYKTFALAPFILLGALITILTKDSLVGVVGKLFTLFWSML